MTDVEFSDRMLMDFFSHLNCLTVFKANQTVTFGAGHSVWALDSLTQSLQLWRASFISWSNHSEPSWSNDVRGFCSSSLFSLSQLLPQWNGWVVYIILPTHAYDALEEQMYTCFSQINVCKFKRSSLTLNQLMNIKRNDDIHFHLFGIQAVRSVLFFFSDPVNLRI